MITRRQFTVTLAAAGGLAVARPRALFAAADPKDASAIPELYRRAVVIDGCSEAFDTNPDGFPVEPKAIAAAAASGVTAINFTVVGPGAGFEETVGCDRHRPEGRRGEPGPLPRSSAATPTSSAPRRAAPWG